MYIFTGKSVCVRACVCAWGRACVSACVCVCLLCVDLYPISMKGRNQMTPKNNRLTDSGTQVYQRKHFISIRSVYEYNHNLLRLSASVVHQKSAHI